MVELGWQGIRRSDASGRRRLALACTMVLVGFAGVQTLSAQVVKAPRYQGGVDAPVQQLNLPPLPPAITPHGQVVEDVVARVNDQIISRSDVERAEQQLQQEAQQNKMDAGELALAQRDLLRDMIDEQLLLSKAKELGLNADSEVIRRLDEIRKENKMDSLDDLAKAAQAQGVNFEDFKAQIRNQILKQEVVRDQVGRKLQLSDTEEQKYYNEHLKDFEQPEQVRLSEILVPLPENATPEQIAQGEAKANDIKTKIQQGGDFADLAKKYSGGPSAAQGGELGLWKRGALAKVLEDAVFPLKVGDSTQPIRTRQGWLIMKVTEHDAAGPSPLKDVEPQIQEALYMQAMQPALRTYLTKLRDDSYVELAPGFTDSGSTGTENKLTYTAYAPPPTKKKKEKAKARFDRTGRYQTASLKTPVVSSPDTTGGRTLTGADAAASPAGAAAIDPATGMAKISAPKSVVAKNGKIKKIKREKIRFGQAPRNSLPGGSADETEPVVAGGAATVAPGAAMATGSVDQTANLADNPLTPAAPERKKTRFAASEPEVKAKKVAAVNAKATEKAIATPEPMTAEEKATAKEQAAPLGLAGDTAKKKKKPKKVKGAPKERLAEQAAAPKNTPAPNVAPTANPSLAPTDIPATPTTSKPTASETVPNSSVPRSVPNQPDTTLPPVTQPVPGSGTTGQPVPGTNPPN
jgi:peptidyl-prolyl cis-trans isomerase SurA